MDALHLIGPLTGGVRPAGVPATSAGRQLHSGIARLVARDIGHDDLLRAVRVAASGGRVRHPHARAGR